MKYQNQIVTQLLEQTLSPEPKDFPLIGIKENVVIECAGKENVVIECAGKENVVIECAGNVVSSVDSGSTLYHFI